MVGRTVNELGIPVAGVEVQTLVTTGVTDAQGRFSLFPHSACPTRTFRVIAMTRVGADGTRLQGLSFSVLPVDGGTTNVGDIILTPRGAALYPGVKFPVGRAPSSVVLGDLNMDGIPDLVTANRRSDDVSVLLGNGDGTFQVEQRLAGIRPFFIAVADLNLNGFPDLITANGSFNSVSVFLHQ